jgi:large repetitive protein
VGSTGAQSLSVDTIAPTVTLTTVNGTAQTFPLNLTVNATSVGGACGIAFGDGANVAVSVTGTSTQNGSATCSGGAWSFVFTTALSGGNYTVTATQTDLAGNNGTSGGKSINVDTTAPAVTLTNVNGSARTFPLSINATVTTVGGACGTAVGDSTTVSVSLTGTSTQNGTATCSAGTWIFTFTTALSANGAYSVTATQTDSFANTGTSGAKSITVDTVLPTVTLTQANGAARTFPWRINATITSVAGACGTASGDSATVSISVTGASTQNGTATCGAGAWTFTFTTPLSTDGLYNVTATQLDAAGNNGTSGIKAITVDKTAPAVTLTQVNGVARTFPFTTSSSIASVGGACGTATGDTATVTITVTGNSTQGGSVACSGGAWQYNTSPQLSSAGTWNFTATQPDSAGNTGTSGTKAITHT